MGLEYGVDFNTSFRVKRYPQLQRVRLEHITVSS